MQQTTSTLTTKQKQDIAQTLNKSLQNQEQNWTKTTNNDNNHPQVIIPTPPPYSLYILVHSKMDSADATTTDHHRSQDQKTT